MLTEDMIRRIQGADYCELDSTGHYQRVDIFEEEPRWPYPGLIILALCIIGWAAFAGMAYCLYQLVEVIAG